MARLICKILILIAVVLAAAPGPGMAAEGVVACERAPVTQERVAELIAADLKAAPPGQSGDMRYLTLVNLLNACATPEQMQIYRHAVVKLLNSLSWAPQPVRLRTIDPDGAIVGFRLSALGWTETEWQRLLLIYPYGLKPASPAFADATKVSGSPLPYIRGDWFTYLTARPPHYYRMLKMPRSFKTLQLKLGEAAAQDIQSYRGHRTGYTPTKINGRIRLVPEISYSDTPPEAAPAKNSTKFPAGTNVRTVPRQLASTSYFPLPNGFRGYLLHHATGPRLDFSPLFPCQVCNFAGLDVTLEGSGQDKFRQDKERYDQALAAAGLNPDLVSETRLEPIRALGEKFGEERLTIWTAAAEFGVAADELESRMMAAGKQAFHTARVLAQHSMPRRLFQNRFKAIAETATDLKPLRTEAVGKYVGFGSVVRGRNWRERRSAGFELSLVSSKSVYRQGELLQLSVRPQFSCNLTLINVAGDGSAVVIFPNRFNQTTYVSGGRIQAVPDKSVPFKLRLNDKGTEKIVGYCNADNRWSGVKHNFGKTPFTTIGDFEKFLAGREKYRAKRNKAGGLSFPPLIAGSTITFTVE